MCTRFYVEADADEIRDIVSDVQSSQLSDKFNHAGYAVLTSGEIRPTNVVPVIAPGKNGMRAAFPMRWGFQIPGRSLVVNARVETAAEKPTFKEAWEKHRCIIPASWYFSTNPEGLTIIRQAGVCFNILNISFRHQFLSTKDVLDYLILLTRRNKIC